MYRTCEQPLTICIQAKESIERILNDIVVNEYLFQHTQVNTIRITFL